MVSQILKVNRAPVMTLWAAVVAERLGYDREEALSLGRGVAGLNAQSKGRRLGIYEPSEEKSSDRSEKQRQGETESVQLLGRPVPVRRTDQGLRSLNEDRPIDAKSVQRYLESKFGGELTVVREAMEELAGSYEPDELAGKAYDLYEKFRPEIPEGKRGWGALGTFDLNTLRSLHKQA